MRMHVERYLLAVLFVGVLILYANFIFLRCASVQIDDDVPERPEEIETLRAQSLQGKRASDAKKRLHPWLNMLSNTSTIGVHPERIRKITFLTEQNFHRTAQSRSKLILLLATPRSGGLFLGNLFRKMTKLLYFYDPIESVYSHLYGLAEGTVTHSDIFLSLNGTERILPSLEKQKMLVQLQSLLKCKFSKVTDEYLMTNNWLTYGNGLGAKDFITCMFKRRISIKSCAKSLHRVCPEKLDKSPWHQALCQLQLEVLHRKTSKNISNEVTKEFLEYGECKWAKRQILDMKCLPYLKSACLSIPTKLISSVSMNMKLASELLRVHHENISILYMIRDPRTVVFSRIQNRKYLHQKTNPDILEDLFDGTPEMLFKEKNVIKRSLGFEVKSHCDTVVKDLTEGQKLLQEYPGSVFFITYEDFLNRTQENINSIYTLLSRNSKEYDQHTKLFLKDLNKSKKDAWLKAKDLYDRLKRYKYEELFQYYCQDLFKLVDMYQ